MKNIFKIALLGLVMFGTATAADASVTTKKNVMPTEITPLPGFQLITLAEAKQHLRIEADYTYDDEILQTYIQGAISVTESYVNRGRLSNATLVVTQTDAVPVWITDWRLNSLTSVKIKYDGDADFTDLPSENFSKAYNPCGDFYGIEFKNIDVLGLDELRTEFALTVPASIKNACLLTLADFYEYREDRGDIYNRRAQTLLRDWRNYD